MSWNSYFLAWFTCFYIYFLETWYIFLRLNYRKNTWYFWLHIYSSFLSKLLFCKVFCIRELKANIGAVKDDWGAWLEHYNCMRRKQFSPEVIEPRDLSAVSGLTVSVRVVKISSIKVIVPTETKAKRINYYNYVIN